MTRAGIGGLTGVLPAHHSSADGGDFDLVAFGRALLADPDRTGTVATRDLDALHGFRRAELEVLR